MAIGKIFREAGYIEKLGTGILTTFAAYEEWGLPEPTIIDGENFVKCILPRTSAISVVVPDDFRPILKLFTTADELAVSDLIEGLHMPRATATRRLNELVKKGVLVRIGKGTRYKKNRAIVRSLFAIGGLDVTFSCRVSFYFHLTPLNGFRDSKLGKYSNFYIASKKS